MGSVQYHSDRLQKMGKIISTRDGLYKLHYQSGVFQDEQMKMLQVLNQETPREIMMFIIEQGDPTQKDLVNRLNISAPSVHWHLKRLIASNLIEEVRVGKYKKYKVSPSNANLISELLKAHHSTIWNRWSSRLIDVFLSLSSER